MKYLTRFSMIMGMFFLATNAHARISISPYVSVKSTKKIKPTASGEEKAVNKTRTEAGVRAGLSFYRLFRFELGIGQSQLTTTQKVVDTVDEYDEIDFEEDLDMDTSDPDSDIKVTETQRNAKVSVVLDPSFGPFILRAKAGVTARQRIIVTEQAGQPNQTLTHGPTFKPHSGFGFGIKLTRSMYAIAEYEMYHYAFPEIEPFERELTVSVNVAI